MRDSGLLHSLMGLSDITAVERHPKLGASWEGFALEELLRSYEIPASDAYFWRTQAGAELDLLIHCQGQKLGFEFKYSDRPQMTPSMRIALADLQLDHLTVVYPGPHSLPLDTNVSVMSIQDLYKATPMPTN